MKLRLVPLVAVLALTLTASAQGAYPNSIASTGDSITRAFNDCRFPYVDCPSASWSTGTLELFAIPPHPGGRNTGITGRSDNAARSPGRHGRPSTARCRA